MFLWLAFTNPPLYWYLYTLASVRHAAWGMPYHIHRHQMLTYFGI
jgi:hypothetical protein